MKIRMFIKSPSIKRYLVLLLLVGSLSYLLGWSRILTVESIAITGLKGATTLTEKKVRETSGIRLGEKLARVSTRTVSRNLKIYPEIASIGVKRKPLHGVELNITLRKIEIAIPIQGERYLLGDKSGVTFIARSQVPSGVLIIGGDRKYLRAAIEIYEVLPAELQKRVLRVDAPSKASIALTLAASAKKSADRTGSGSLRIFWGSNAEQEVKVRVLAALLSVPANKSISFIDLATPLTPTLR